MVITEKDTLARINELNEDDKKEYLKKVNSRKKANKSPDERVKFKPASPHDYPDLFDQKKINYDQPITKFIDKKLKIDHEGKTVFTAKKGIFTNPGKKGTSTTPGILFSYKPNQKGAAPIILQRSKSQEKKDERMAFKPSSVVMDAPFVTDKDLFGEDPAELKTVGIKSMEMRKAPKLRYKLSKPKFAVEHMAKFKPSHNDKLGVNSLFREENGIPFSPFVAKERLNKPGEKPEFKKPFTYNKLDQISVFSPPMSSFVGNLKREFPKVFRK